MQSFMPVHFFVMKIRTIENGFADPKRFRDFRETGPWYCSNHPMRSSRPQEISIFEKSSWHMGDYVGKKLETLPF